jgi:hypothetical protein
MATNMVGVCERSDGVESRPQETCPGALLSTKWERTNVRKAFPLKSQGDVRVRLGQLWIARMQRGRSSTDSSHDERWQALHRYSPGPDASNESRTTLIYSKGNAKPKGSNGCNKISLMSQQCLSNSVEQSLA